MSRLLKRLKRGVQNLKDHYKGKIKLKTHHVNKSDPQKKKK